MAEQHSASVEARDTLNAYLEQFQIFPDVYGIHVKGDSMRPRIKSGEYVVAAPGAEAQPRDEVVVKLRDERFMVKELLAAHDGEMSFGSINASFGPATPALVWQLTWWQTLNSSTGSMRSCHAKRRCAKSGGF